MPTSLGTIALGRARHLVHARPSGFGARAKKVDCEFAKVENGLGRHGLLQATAKSPTTSPRAVLRDALLAADGDGAHQDAGLPVAWNVRVPVIPTGQFL